jgi:hypothetical protein
MAAEGRRTYDQAFSVLRWVYLEDSWVIGIDVHDGVARLELEAVLTEDHPAYHPRRAGEQYCYQRLVVVVTGVTAYVPSGRPPNIDPDGSLDYDNVDAFIDVGNHLWHIEGGWGAIDAQDPTVRVEDA